MRRTTQARLSRPKFKNISDIERFRSFVLYGRSGTGKTTLAATFPKPILYLDVRDEGTDSIADVPDIKVLEVSEFAELEETYWWLKQNPEFRTIVIDTVSQLQQIVVEEQASKKKSKGRPGDWGTLTKRDWGDIAALMKEWLINYRDLSKLEMDVVFIAQDRTFNFDEDEEGEGVLAPEVGPALSPSIARTLNAAVSMIGNTFIRSRDVVKEVNGKKKRLQKIEYCLRIGPNPVYITKVRKPKSTEAPSVIVDPRYEDILEIINGE